MGAVHGVADMNGVAVAYAVALTNAFLSLLFSFGINLSDTQRSAIVTFVNAALVLTAHLASAQAQKRAAALLAAVPPESHV